MAEPMPTPSGSSFTELLSRLARDSSTLVREELALARREMKDSARALAVRLAWVVVGAVLGLVALSTLSAAAVIGLSRVMDLLAAALVVGVGLAAVAGIVAWAGVRRLRQVSLKPVQTMETLEEGKQWIRELR